MVRQPYLQDRNRDADTGKGCVDVVGVEGESGMNWEVGANLCSSMGEIDGQWEAAM